MFQASLFERIKRLGGLSCQDCAGVSRVVRPEGPDSSDLDVQAAEAGMRILASNGYVLLATTSFVGVCVMQHTTITF